MISDAERQRRSEQARRQHAAGILGSPTVARRAAAASVQVRTRRASALAASLLHENQAAIREAVADTLRRGKRSERLKAIDLLMKAGLRAEVLDATVERDQHEGRSREELLDLLVGKLTTGPAGELVRAQIEASSVIDAEVVEP
jgi:hypothetical protein